MSIPITVSPGTDRTATFTSGSTSASFNYAAPQDADCDDERISLGFGALPSNVVTGSPSSATLTVRDDDDCATRPATPTGLQGTAGDGTITLTWDPVDGAEKYKVQQAAGTGEPLLWALLPTLFTSPNATITGLTNGEVYHHQVRSENSAGASDWSAAITTILYFPAPTGLDVVPLPYREARLSWGAVSGASGYVVKAKTGGAGSETTSIIGGSNTSHKILLDDIVNGEGLAEAPAYEFQVKATGAYPNVGIYSREVRIIDTPVTAVNGDSRGTEDGNGEAKALWEASSLQEIVGLDFSAGTVSFRYRKFGAYNSGDSTLDHIEVGWKPEVFVGTPETTSNNPITGLDHEEIYAIQFIYEKTTTGADGPETTKVYAARDVYVWPSDEAAGVINQNGEYVRNHERVATFPLGRHVIQGDNYYEYRVCKETFPSGTVTIDGIEIDKQDAWSKVVEHALEQWEVATDGLVTMTSVEAECADYSDYVEDIEAEIDDLRSDISNGDALSDQQVLYLRTFVEGLEGIVYVRPLDRIWSEIKMVNVSGLYPELHSVGNNNNSVIRFDELASEIGLSKCIFDLDDAGTKGCAVPEPRKTLTNLNTLREIVSTDILLHQENLLEDIGSDPPSLSGGDVRFNKCPTDSHRAYQTLVHEAGHALGIREGDTDDPYYRDHPLESQSPVTVMSYNTSAGLRCSPHPFDILAIYAIYQTR